MIAILAVTTAVLLLLGFPIFICLILSSILVIVLFDPAPLQILAQAVFGALDSFALMAVPFFIFAANLMDRGGLSQRLINLVQLVFAPMRGSLGLTTVGASQLFGAISGSSPATVVAIGSILYPALLKSGYQQRFVLGLITSSGSLGILIPPSIAMIIFATITNASVGALFLAGIGAGLAFGFVLMAYVTYYAYRYNIPVGQMASTREIFDAAKAASWALGAPLVIVGGIYSGIFTPTEAAGIVTAYAIFVVRFVYGELSWRDVLRVAGESAVLTAQIMIIVAASGIFAWLLTVSQFQETISSIVSAALATPMLVLIMINLALLVAGMFIDPNSAQVILVPLLFPIAIAIGIDPIHFGMIVTANLAIGMFTPPFGLNLFVASNLFQVPIRDCVMASLPFILLSLVAVVLISWFPSISLFIPRLAGYSG